MGYGDTDSGHETCAASVPDELSPRSWLTGLKVPVRNQLAPLFWVCGKIHMPGTGEGTKLLQSQAKIRVRKGEGERECKVP